MEIRDLKDIIMLGDVPIVYSGRSLKITVSQICKRLGLTEEDGFRFFVLKDGTVILRPIKNYKEYITKLKEQKTEEKRIKTNTMDFF